MVAGKKVGIVVVCLSLAAGSSRSSLADVPLALQGIGFDQRLNQQIPLDAQFTETGKEIHLNDYFDGKPVILVLAYYQCPRLCTLVLNGLVQGMLEMDLDAGKDFNVITVSFDPREDWRLAASKKESYLCGTADRGRKGLAFSHGKGGPDQATNRGRRFSISIRPRAESIHSCQRDYDSHAGRQDRAYFYDVNYPGRDLRLGLVEASNNKIGSPVDQILLYCFHYDATLGRYSASIMNMVAHFGRGHDARDWRVCRVLAANVICER